MALRQHRLPRLWLALTLGSLLTGVGLVYWWERQLPARIERAATSGDLDACLRYGEQLAALSWLPGGSPQEQGRCRRDRASQLWQQRQWQAALRLQRQLVNSPAARPGDRQRLELWQESLRNQALERFQAGDLAAALTALQPLGAAHNAEGTALGDELKEIWNRNKVQLERAEKLSGQARWWEALDALNRLDHPWWQQRSTAVRAKVQRGIASLAGKEKEHDSHGSLPHTVATDKLDALVQKKIGGGMNEWQAFEAACRELGGRVVEAGPESACQR